METVKTLFDDSDPVQHLTAIRMKRADAKAWLDALRSGKYKQGKQKMHNEVYDTYCCLGVLQKCISGEIVMQKSTSPYREFEEVPSMDWLKKHNIQLFDMFERLGNNPYIGEFGRNISELNDDVGMSFSQIADVIEQNIEYID